MISKSRAGFGKSSITAGLLVILVTGFGGYTLLLQGQVEDLTTQLDNLESRIGEEEDLVRVDSLSIEVDSLKGDVMEVRNVIDELPLIPDQIVGPPGPIGPEGPPGVVGPQGPPGLAEELSVSPISELFEISRESIVAVRTSTGGGSGWVFDNRNHIVTNNHVVSSAFEVEVVLHDGTILEALVIGTDPFSDLAVLRIIDSQIWWIGTDLVQNFPFSDTKSLKQLLVSMQLR